MPKSNQKMRIAQIAPVANPVSGLSNKAIYSHIAHLVDGFSAQKHKVSLYGHPESEVTGNLFSSSLELDTEQKQLNHYEQWGLLSDCYLAAQQKAFDLIHSHLHVMTGFFSRLEKNIPTLISVHSPIEDRVKQIMLDHRDEKYISFSLAQRQQLPEVNWYANVYHGVDTNLFAYEENPDDYVLFIGRLTHDKGAHIAIASCMEADIPLRLAGRSYGSEDYWHTSIEPHINGGSVRYFGEVSLAEKIPLIQKARAIVFPTLYHEAFGYVLIEAMSCGTPVIAFPNGSVPEIVKDGVTGFLVNDQAEMVKALHNIDSLDRKKVRNRAEQFFSLKQMLSHYENVYSRAISETAFKKKK